MFSREHKCDWRERATMLELELSRLKDKAPFVDPATGVGNLHHLDLQFTQLLGRWRRYGEPFALTIVGVSDLLVEGGNVPPVALPQLALALLRTIRAEDTICRVSESEFAILLANSTAQGAGMFLERARNQIARDPNPTGEGSHFYRSAGGVAEWTDAVGSLPELLRLANTEMRKLRREIAAQSRAYKPSVQPVHGPLIGSDLLGRVREQRS